MEITEQSKVVQMLSAGDIEQECNAVMAIVSKKDLLKSEDIRRTLCRVMRDRLQDGEFQWILMDRVVRIGPEIIPLIKEIAPTFDSTDAKSIVSIALASLKDMSLKSELVDTVKNKQRFRFPAARLLAANQIPDGKDAIGHLIESYVGRDLDWNEYSELTDLLDSYAQYPDTGEVPLYKGAKIHAENTIKRLKNQ